MTRSLLTGTCGLALLVLSAGGLQAQQQPASQMTPAASQSTPASSAGQPADASQIDDKDMGGAEKGTGANSVPDDGLGPQNAGSDGANGADADKPPATLDFEGGKLTITQTEQYGEKVLAFDGKELAHNYQVDFDRVVTVDGVGVAMVDVGDGGNQCGPTKVLVWKSQGGSIETETVEQDGCGAPPAAVGQYAIYFVPFLLPGDAKPARQWSPKDGLTTSGLLSYAPEPGTGWGDVDPSKYDNIIDAFHNEAIYKAARKLLGKDLTDMATSLLVGGGTQETASGAFYATGCVPHDCGGNDGFMAVDVNRHALYFARQGDNGRPLSWPPMRRWPDDIREAYQKGRT